jgi:general secretion pathway protein H
MTLRRDSGFTLIELMIVLAIVSLVTALTLPLFGARGSGAALAGATAELRAALTAARSTAIAESRDVAFSGDARGYRIDGRPHAMAGGNAGLRVEIRGGSRISFFPSGGSSGGRVVLYAANARREFEIEAVTGRAIPLP